MATRIGFNPHVTALPAYNAGLNLAVAQRISGRDDIARLASNENPDGCSPEVLAALAPAVVEPWRYADPACAALREALSAHLGIAPDCIVAGNGSEEMIAAVSRAVLQPGQEVLTVVPSFGLHEIEPLAVGARVTKVPMTADLDFDLDALVAALARAPRLFMLSSPWNPVGPALSRESLKRLIGAMSPDTLLVFDEAYFEYAGGADVPDGIASLSEAGVRFVVLRTFSKAYGLAGLRVGYAVCSDAELAVALSKAKTPFNVNAAAQAAAVAALGDQAWMKASVARTRVELERVAASLRAMGFVPARSQTNFLFFDCGQSSTHVAEGLLREGIIVKPWREPGYEQFLRVTIGHAGDNDRFLEALHRLTA
jgi:histidinol-phosphate aminotransferase